MKNNSKYVLFLAFLIFGAIVAAQVKTNFNRNKLNSASKYQVDQLRTMLNEEQENINKLKLAIAENEKVRENHLKSAVNNADNNFLKWQHSYLDDIKQKAGFMDIKGPGLIIKLVDAPARKNYPIGWLIIHDSDIKKIVNDLKISGVQAMSINGERLMATSEQVCAGPTILINKNRYPVPYIIKVIGNPDTLNKMFEESNIIKLMRNEGIRIDVEKSKEVVITKYAHKVDNLIEGMEAIEK